MIDLNKIKRLMEKERCPEHGQTTKIKVMNDGIQMDACCDKFEAKLEGIYQKELDKTVDDSLGSSETL